MRLNTTLYSTLAAVGLALGLSPQPALGLVTVTVQPGSQTVLVGGNAVFTAQVTPSAGETITGYAWLTSTNAGGPFNTVAGATTNTCTLTNVQTIGVNYCFARVTYSDGVNSGLTSASAAVTFTVLDQARITAQPQNGGIRVAGSNVTFSVSALGQAPLSYQWRLNGTKLSNSGRINGATSNVLTVSALITNDSGSYDVVVTNIYAAVTSQVATLSVFDPPGISVPPQNTGVIIGSNAVLSVTATGSSPLGFRWRKDGVALSNGGRISGATTNRLTIAAATTNDEGGYSVSISNIVGALTSSPATLTVLIPATITSATNAEGRQGAFFSFTNTATGTLPITFGADGLPAGLSIEPASGVISGIPDVMGVFEVAVYATNPAMTTTGRLTLTLTTGVPGITSPLTAYGKQGQDFSCTITASNDPVSFSASGLPAGLSCATTNEVSTNGVITKGIISGLPMVSGIFPITIGASNRYGADSQVLTLSITSSVPVILSSLVAYGKQGQNFSYTIVTSDPAQLSASGLPPGLSFATTNEVSTNGVILSTKGIISGPPIVSGTFQIALGATNQFGSDSRVLTLILASSVPVITSARTKTGTENQSGFSYTILATDSPTQFGASGLPLGLNVNPTTGVISGTPWYGGTFTCPIWAINAWGTGMTNLVLNISYATPANLVIANVINTWSKPYLLDFAFSLRDGNARTANPVVKPPSQFQVVCMEDGVPIPTEAPLILRSVMDSGSKQLKTFLALDYTSSMYVVPGAIDAMEAAAQLIINEQPPHALFGVIEFHTDFIDPQFVTNSMTSPGNYFITDKAVLNQSIAGIETNYVVGNYGGTRCWDAMYAALNQFGANNPDEQRYLIAMTDGNDGSSLLNTTSDPMDAVNTLVQLAQANHVAIYCVAYGTNVNTNSLQVLTSQTGGRYYLAATTSDLGSQFERIQKDISGQYVLRWATLKRAAVPGYLYPGFQPSFEIRYGNLWDNWNTNIVYTNVVEVDDTQTPPVTNTFTTNLVQYPFNPPDWTNDVRLGSMRLVQDADIGPQTIRLRATYVPRYVRQIQVNYRPNYPCTPTMESTGTNEMLSGWNMTETADTNGLRTLTLTSPNPTNLLTSIAYAAFGDLVSFNFTYPEWLTATQAFSVITNNNTIYTNVLPSGIRFTNQNFPSFVTVYPPMPPHGTPIPWLMAYGFKTNFAAAELIATNGLPVWQAYLAGLNPTNAASQFRVWTAFAPGQMPQILFSTVGTRTYQVETATSLGGWSVLRNNIPGNGGYILFIDNRPLSGVNSVFYRVGVY